MRIVSFYNNNRSNNVLHIETENCIVNIRVNLKDTAGNKVTSVEIIPDQYADRAVTLDGTSNNRIIKLPYFVKEDEIPSGFVRTNLVRASYFDRWYNWVKEKSGWVVGDKIYKK